VKQPEATTPARGPAEDYCPGQPEGHHMVSHHPGNAKLIRFVERCSLCGWIDGVALDRWAEQAYKEQMTTRAQRIALASETQPFAFVQESDADLTLQEILGQALGAASVCWEFPDRGGVFDSTRAKRIYDALEREVDRALRLRERALREGEMQDWVALAHELYALACNSSPMEGYPAKQRQEWQDAFVRLREQFHYLLPKTEEARANGREQESQRE
jgi:hypothetical protein